MRILLVQTYHYPRGGDCTYTFALADLLRSRGHDVSFFAMKHPMNLPCAEEGYFVEHIDFREMVANQNPWNAARVLARSIYSVVARQRLAGLLRDMEPDVAHLQNVHGHLTPSVLHALRDAGVPAVWTLHDYRLICPNSHLLSHGKICEDCKGGKFRSCIVRRCKKGSLAASTVAALEARVHSFLDLPGLVSTFVSPSRFLQEKFVEFGWSRERLVHIRNFLTREQLDRPSGDDRGYALYLGQIESWKGVGTLLAAAGRVPEVPVVFAGDGTARADLERAATASGIGNVRFEGHLSGERLREIVEGASFVVVPSECYENCPYSVMEAMAAGKPVVATRLGGLPELVADGVNGFLVDPGNDAALANAMRRLAGDPALRDALGARGRERALAEFSPDLHYHRIHAVYETALGTPAMTPEPGLIAAVARPAAG